MANRAIRTTLSDEVTAITLVNDLKTKYNDAVVLINELKTKLNAKLAVDRDSGQQTT